MNYEGKLTHKEKVQALADCLRDIMSSSITDRKMPNLLSRGKVVSNLISIDIKEEIMEQKRQGIETILLNTDIKATKKLKKVKQVKQISAPK